LSRTVRDTGQNSTPTVLYPSFTWAHDPKSPPMERRYSVYIRTTRTLSALGLQGRWWNPTESRPPHQNRCASRTGFSLEFAHFVLWKRTRTKLLHYRIAQEMTRHSLQLLQDAGLREAQRSVNDLWAIVHLSFWGSGSEGWKHRSGSVHLNQMRESTEDHRGNKREREEEGYLARSILNRTAL
jgi:hypothetical protein